MLPTLSLHIADCYLVCASLQPPDSSFFALLLHKRLHLIGNSAFDFASLDTELFTYKINQMKFNDDISPVDLIWNSPVLHNNPHPS